MAIYNLLKYKPNKNSELKYIFDTNIWLYLFSDLHEDMEREISAYSNLLEEIIDNDYEILLPSFVLSEFANVLLRTDYNLIKDNLQSEYRFKRDYVGSNDYLSKTQEITHLIDQILNIDNIVKIDDNFSNINIGNIKSNFKILDWNDAYLIELAKTKKSIIVSHDSDFSKFHSDDFDMIRLF